LGEPVTGEGASDLGAEIVAAVGHRREVIQHRLKCLALGGEQGLTR